MKPPDYKAARKVLAEVNTHILELEALLLDAEKLHGRLLILLKIPRRKP